MMEGGKEEGEREGGRRQGRRGEKGSIGLVGWRFIYNAERPGGGGGCACVLVGGGYICVFRCLHGCVATSCCGANQQVSR